MSAGWFSARSGKAPVPGYSGFYRSRCCSCSWSRRNGLAAVLLVGVAGSEVQLGPAVSAVERPGKNAGSCLGRPAFVPPQLLYPFSLSLINDGGLGILEYFLVLNRVSSRFLNFKDLV